MENDILKLQNDVAEALDKGSMSALIMLDLSSAFDVSASIEAFMLLYLCHKGKGINLGNVIHCRQNSVSLNRG